MPTRSGAIKKGKPSYIIGYIVRGLTTYYLQSGFKTVAEAKAWFEKERPDRWYGVPNHIRLFEERSLSRYGTVYGIEVTDLGSIRAI